MALADTPTKGVGDVGAYGEEDDKGGESPTGFPTPTKKGRKPAAAKKIDPSLTFDWLLYLKNRTCQVLCPILDIKTDDNKTLGQI